MNLYIGIDVSKNKLDYCALNSDQDILNQDEVINSQIGANTIKEVILRLARLTSFDNIVIGLEATSVYDIHPAMFFQLDEDLNQLPLSVTTLNPKYTYRFSQLFDDDKTDQNDALHIADYLRMEHYQTPVLRQEEYLALQRLTRERFHIVGQITDCKHHFLNNLFYKLNRAEAELPTSVFGSAMMEVLTNRYSLDEISETPLEVLAADLNNLSHGRFGNAEEIAKALKRAVRNSYRLDKVMEDSVDVVLGMYADEIKMLSKQLKLLDKSIERICVAIPEVKPLLSIPGIGKIYAAGIIAELGQINRFKNEAQIAGYAGLTWRRSQSGESERQTTPLTHNGNQYLRYYLVEAANMVRINEPVFANYYKKKYSEVPKYQHRRAIVLSARKLIRLVYTLTTKHQLYQSPKMV